MSVFDLYHIIILNIFYHLTIEQNTLIDKKYLNVDRYVKLSTVKNHLIGKSEA